MNEIRTGASLLLLIVLMACVDKNRQAEDSSVKSIKGGLQVFISQSGVKFVVDTDHSLGASIASLKVTTKGFSAVNTVHDLGNVDPVAKIFLNDLDKNGFEEIYIITRSAGSGSYSNIYGLASNRDKSATPIFVRPISEKDISRSGLFEGFMGHNTFKIKNGKLVNSFPVFNADDSNAKPTGGTRSIEYRLFAGEAGWILEPSGRVD